MRGCIVRPGSGKVCKAVRENLYLFKKINFGIYIVDKFFCIYRHILSIISKKYQELKFNPIGNSLYVRFY